MKTFRITLTILLLNLFSNVFSQQVIDLTDIFEGSLVNIEIKQENKKIDGTPYFNKEWEKGTVKFLNGNEYRVKFFKYDVNLERLLFLKDDVTYYIPNKGEIEKFTIGTSNFVYIKYDDKNIKAFFEVLSNGEKIKLLKKYKCVYVEGKKGDGIAPAINDKYSINKSYYIKIANEPAIKFKVKKDDVLQLMSDNKELVEEYIKKNKLKFKNENDLAKIFDFYSTHY
ncbi:MAG: hypothetical protein KAT68_12085 [Bacteroidales bacterium]|nr:hypothetical protein [Bacteroidales bacterium]